MRSRIRSDFTLPRCSWCFFLLVVVLGLFSIWRLSNFNRLSADVAEVWLPNTRVLGDLNNFTSDFRAIEGSNLLSSDPAEIAATEKQMAGLDRSIAEAERGFERIRHDGRGRPVRPLQGALERLPENRQPDPGAVAHQPQGGGAGDLCGRLARRLRRGERHARSTHRPGGRQRAGRERSPRRRLSAGLLAHPPRHGDRGRDGRRRARSYQPFHFAPLLQSRRPHAPLAANNTDIDIPETDGGTRSAKWRRPPWSFATTRSS
jgi:hypothetical protein